MNEVHELDIRVRVLSHKGPRDVSLRLKRYIPFVPREGMTFLFTHEDDALELEIKLINLVYDYNARVWIETQEDEALAEELRDGDNPACTITRERMEEYLAQYLAHGFEVMG